MSRGCGTCRPPADGTPDREILDAFGDFLRAVGPPRVEGQPDTDLSLAEQAHVYRQIAIFELAVDRALEDGPAPLMVDE